ncbi:MAG: hypothetical protein K9H26_00415 [Prolixibacteraceae bacterium]|nr:hypothetical protein [Prolixibacteraceae bacterium]
MKNIQLVILSLLFFFIYSCDKDLTNDQIQSLESLESNFDINSQFEAIELFAVAISKSMQSEEFRSLIRYETNKRFDYDYDVLYRFIRDKKINVPDVGDIDIESFIRSNLEDGDFNSRFPTPESIFKCINILNV